MEDKIIFKAKNRDNFIFDAKELEYVEVHPLQENQIVKTKETIQTKQTVKKQSSKRVTNISFDPLSSNLLAPGITEDYTDEKKDKRKGFEDKYLEDWKRQRRDVIANYSSRSNLPAITILHGENSPR